ncbi:WD-40 repeat-containing protein MSI2-like isoform X2 [Actinidia eriantha]|uniref:WD-40 repeat-containing protein MSI2-like isoform X2 n=1 Tax=Actinidia eriantha TaxID=165200 RepID=UPI002583395D|nr:WD-40 repeat-containing protein MSI2-like isoform X2 [Actinidia eriantha]
MLQNPSLVAAKTSGCHDKEGYGLSWSQLKEGYLLSGSNDCKICLWDVSAMPENKLMDATHVYEAHGNIVGDVDWHLKDENLFGSVGDDCYLMIWDLRTNKPQHSVQAHEKEGGEIPGIMGS